MRLKPLRMLTCFLLLFCFFAFFQSLVGNSDLQNLLKEPKKVEENQEVFSVPQEGSRPTQTVITSSSEESSIYSQPVVFFAHVVPTRLPASIPTGTIQFEVDQVLASTQPLANGETKFTISNLSPTHLKQHSITAIYSGDEIFESSRDYWNLWVYPAKTSCVIKAGPNSSVLNQLVKFTVGVNAEAPAKATPNGLVELFIDGSSFATGELDTSGKAIFSTADISVGAHTITAIYQGNENFQASQIQLTQQVDRGPTKTQLTSSENPSLFGQPMTFTVKVTSSAGIPDGMVQLMMNELHYGNPLSLDSNGQTIIILKDLPSGSYNIEAHYLGNKNFDPSTSLLTQMIGQAKTETDLISSENPSTYGIAVRMTAKVTSETARPQGWIRFRVDGKEFGSIQSLSRSGQVSVTLNQLTAGSHQIEAEYSGNENFSPSADSLMQQVKKAKTTGLTSSKNPSTYGSPVKITAKVTAEGLQPTGLVQFKIDGKNFEEARSLKNGQVSVIIQHLNAGTHQIEANYLGSENFSPSDVVLTQQIDKADTSTTVVSSVNPSILGQSVTFTATVAAHKKLTGTIQFQINEEKVGDPLKLTDSHQATLTVFKELKKGEHRIIAIYSGDENFNPSTSAPLLQMTHLAILPPTLVTGFQINNAIGNEINWVNILRWKPPTEGEIPVAYHIYRDSELKTLIATIPSKHELEFIDPIRKREPFYTYFIVSVDAAGNESEPVGLKVTPLEQ